MKLFLRAKRNDFLWIFLELQHLNISLALAADVIFFFS